jgi:hypothetical protein
LRLRLCAALIRFLFALDYILFLPYPCYMNKKFFISLLMFVFLLANTGLPVTLHFCAMQNMTGAKKCPMCSSAEQTHKKSCCSKNIPEAPVKISGKSCCQTKVVPGNINESYVKLITNTEELQQLISSAIVINSVINNYVSDLTLSYNLSPPLIIKDNPIYILSSSLLI